MDEDRAAGGDEGFRDIDGGDAAVAQPAESGLRRRRARLSARAHSGAQEQLIGGATVEGLKPHFSGLD